ncbi:MAG: hypothetical protein ABJB47_08620 [Actinomycetota bacterium]
MEHPLEMDAEAMRPASYATVDALVAGSRTRAPTRCSAAATQRRCAPS